MDGDACVCFTNIPLSCGDASVCFTNIPLSRETDLYSYILRDWISVNMEWIPSLFHERFGGYHVLSTGEGCGETPACGGQCPHHIKIPRNFSQ
jgi:hypothetical protein